MRNVIALAGKDLKLLLRDKPGFFFTFFFPVLYASFFGFIMGGMGDSPSIKVAVVDEDDTPGSRAFVEKLAASAEIRVWQTDRQTAVNVVRRGKYPAYLIVPEGFGDAYERPLVKGFPEVETGMDPSRKAEQGLLQGVLAKYLFQQIANVYTNPDNARKLIGESLAAVREDPEIDPIAKAALLTFLPALDRFLVDLPQDEGQAKIDFANFGVRSVEVSREDHRPKTAFDITIPQGIVWALLACSASFGISLVTERTKGTLVRLRMLPITGRDILSGKALACFATTLGVTVALMVFARLAFGVRPDSVPLLVLAIVCVCLCFVGIMMFLSVLGRTEQSAAGVGWAILMVMAMIGGGMLPLAFMPAWMQTISHVSPIKWSIYALEGAIWRGFSANEMMLPCAILLGIGAACFAIGVRAFRWFEQG